LVIVLPDFAMVSKHGSRTLNEDYCRILDAPHGWLFAVADGLGGHGRGEEASKAVADVSAEVFKMNPPNMLDECFRRGQDYLMAEQIRLGAQNEMKTTLVLLNLCGGIAQAGFIGDSRFYHFKGHKYISRSLDHSVPQILATNKQIKESQIRGHEDRNRLLRVMGVEWNAPKYELLPPINTGDKDRFLLCTDGFWELIDEAQMQKALKAAKSPQAWLDAMEETVIRAGADKNMDNYTAVAIWM
jgi:serine/threonine protein phosphatase PrpC